jgi:hypothetical protein
MFIQLCQLFIVALVLNLIWEFLHSCLYQTCQDAPKTKYFELIISASLKDGFFITLFFYFSYLMFENIDIFANYGHLTLFIILCLVFSFFDEKYSLKHQRWQYTDKMPLILGVGVTPLLELAVTGLLALLLI